MPNGSLGAGPGRVERTSAIQLIGPDTLASVQSSEATRNDGEDEWEQACRLQAEFDEGIWEAIAGDKPRQTLNPMTFHAAKKSEGQRPGLEFKKGDQGFGYYPMRPAIISLATELAIPETFHHPVRLELDKLFPTDNDLHIAMTAPNRKKVGKRRKQRERKRGGPLDSMQVAKAVKDSGSETKELTAREPEHQSNVDTQPPLNAIKR